ncbi:XrtB/PEP-CTERM-associated polysaccharide biosynthesis outer membrane protein EpsL [Polaromonas sp. YR568]|uniref:XrtB/PEP-CTERM-associated polysaccharide biosynthesis outer membrane protein EpsL n=1 Tax=Polaromonas sp. YR568 TaxID=1855301 RepID=UPI00398BD548
MSSHRTLLPVPLLVLGLFPLAAHADDLDTLQFKAGQSVTHDSNVFRLSDSANAQAVIGTPDRDDTVAVTTAGFKINKPYGLQRFELEAGVEDHHYSRFSYLDFTAVNYAAAWRWSFTPALHGNLTTDRSEYVDPYADVQARGQINRRTNRSTVFDAEYELDGAWRLVGGVFERTSSNSQPFTFEGDTKVHGGEAGVRYVYPSGTSMAYRFRDGKGEYPGRVPSPVSAGNFTDREHEFRLDWAPTGKTTLRAKAAYFDRAHDGLSARDFSGFTGQLDANWAITAKTSLAGGVVRELGSYQTLNSSYYEGYRFFVAPTWKATEKTAVRLRYDHGARDFKGPLPGFAASNRRDTTDLLSLAVEWQALRALKLTASVQSDRRKSNEPGADYKSNSFGIAADASF